MYNLYFLYWDLLFLYLKGYKLSYFFPGRWLGKERILWPPPSLSDRRDSYSIHSYGASAALWKPWVFHYYPHGSWEKWLKKCSDYLRVCVILRKVWAPSHIWQYLCKSHWHTLSVSGIWLECHSYLSIQESFCSQFLSTHPQCYWL